MRLYYHKSPSDNLVRLAGLVKVLGISADLFEVRSFVELEAAIEAGKSLPDEGMVLDAGGLKAVCCQEDLHKLAAIIGSRKTSVLLLGLEVDEFANRFLQILTKGAVLKVAPVGPAARVNFCGGEGGLAGELASQSYPRKAAGANGLVLGSGADCIMKLDDTPAFVRARAGAASVFVWSTDKVFDIHRPLAAELEFEVAADQYIPAMIFLRFAFKDQCWHNPSAGAGVVIDDPLLTRRYGFINFPQLLDSARTHGYRVTLAFIPWNHWRSRATKARLFRDHSDCFSVCAHGCDHTNNEFKSADYQRLLRKNFVASQRMERHAKRTGLECEPLMVCPQEQYSLEAMRAFADGRQFLGLLCTACMPRNLASPQITGADLLLPAQDSFFGFPVFKRHYWRNNDMSVFAMSLFLGKNAILVEHHEFFRNGPGGVEKFAAWLEKLRPGIKWTSLSETVIRTCLVRRVSENRRDVRFFTDTFKLEHSSKTPITYRLMRRIPETTPVRRVTVDGIDAQTRREDGFLVFEVQLDQPKTMQVQLEVAPTRPARSDSEGIKYQFSVAFRRGVSEFRDNVITRNGLALRASRLLAKTLKQTGG